MAKRITAVRASAQYARMEPRSQSRYQLGANRRFNDTNSSRHASGMYQAIDRNRRRIIAGKRSNSAVGIPSDAQMRAMTKEERAIFRQLSILSHTGSSGRGQG